MKSILSLGLCLALFTGCASIISGQNQSITLLSSKQRPYEIYYRDRQIFCKMEEARHYVKKGTAPDTVTLPRTCRKNYFVAWDGGEQQISGRVEHLNAWYFGNILLGGAPGMIVDMCTGSAGAFDSEVDMDKKEAPKKHQNTRADYDQKA